MSQVSDLMNSLVGQPVWGAKRTNGSSFFLELGAPFLDMREPSSNPEIRAELPSFARRRITPKGEFSILFIDCMWAIAFENQRITDESDVNDIEIGIRYLDGTYLTSFTEQPLPEASFILNFDNKASLHVRANAEVGEFDNLNITIKGLETWALCLDGSVKK